MKYSKKLFDPDDTFLDAPFLCRNCGTPNYGSGKEKCVHCGKSIFKKLTDDEALQEMLAITG
jgi:hypothetical protein